MNAVSDEHVTLYVLPPRDAGDASPFEVRGLRVLEPRDADHVLAVAREVAPRAIVLDDAFSEGAKAELCARLRDDPETASIAVACTGRASPAIRPVPRLVERDGWRVLLVEDHEDSCDLVRELLEGHGYAIETAGCARRALSALLWDGIDVAVIDIGLPDMDGYAVARIARKLLGATAPRLVALTGYAGPDDRARGTRAGFDVYLPKPVDFGELLSAVGPDGAGSGRTNRR